MTTEHAELGWIVYKRPSWERYFLGIARAVAARADCRRACYGAVIVDTYNRIVSTGYNGSPPGEGSCLTGDCPRGMKTYEELPGQEKGNNDYSDCISLHAETNAVCNADVARCRGATLYLARIDGGPSLYPCDGCKKVILAAGITRVVI